MTRIFALIVACGLVTAATVQAQGTAPTALVNPNTATEAQLTGLPHMNAATAKALIGKRPFANMTAVDTLLTGQGLTRPQLTELYGRLFLPLDLNTATDAEILLIPNLGNRMLGEFKEYRPYKAIEQFRREMGKYVNAAEVARLERYVVVK